MTNSPLSRNAVLAALYAAVAAFLTYASVYAFRKAFTAATFDGLSFGGISYKVWLVFSQVLGYTASKFYGIKFISELKSLGRWKIILILVGVAWLAWLGFALIPAPWNIIFLFINGFPLGMLWGTVFSYVEGRRATDFIGAALAVSFIFSSGFVKTVAKYIMLNWGVTELWMPFVTGLVFVLPLLFFVWLIERIPPPSEEDIKARNIRLPMTGEDRIRFFNKFSTGIVILVIIYVFLTIFRDIRDNFMADMWKELGFEKQPALFTQTELPTTLITLAMMAALILVRNNLRAFMIGHGVIIAGFIVAGLSTYLFTTGHLGAVAWMTLTGLGLYMGYIPFNCMLFERLLASFKQAGNVGFLIYIADSFGYLGSTGVIVMKEIVKVKANWTVFFSNSVLLLSAFGVLGTVLAMIYFNKKHQQLFPKGNE